MSLSVVNINSAYAGSAECQLNADQSETATDGPPCRCRRGGHRRRCGPVSFTAFWVCSASRVCAFPKPALDAKCREFRACHFAPLLSISSYRFSYISATCLQV
jgi:hypothetical protein